MSHADVSVEVAHLYMRSLTRERALEEASREERVLRPLLESLRADGLAVSHCVLVDDTSGSVSAEESQAFVLDVCAEVGLRVDYVVRESACAHGITTMLAFYFPEEPLEAGDMLGTGRHIPVVDALEDGDRWLANGEPGRFQPPAEPLLVPTVDAEPAGSTTAGKRRTGGRGTRSHSIHLDVELWSVEARAGSIVWSCPSLAAWWQLLRLGAPMDDRVRPVPEHSDAPPFAAATTLTVLPPSFLVVEDAVRTILSRVDVPAEWLPSVRGHGPLGLLERMNYIFPAALPARS
jgi:hypothetical protein